jgi:hypothetical protein
MEALTFFRQFILDNLGYLSLVSLLPRITHTLTVARYNWGYAIETVAVDDEGVVTTEFLTSLDGVVALLVARDRFGDAHDDMRTYPRDSKYPVGGKVYLKRSVTC